MYSKNIIVSRNVKYRTVRIMEQVGRFIDLPAEKRIGIISIHQEEEIVISVQLCQQC